MPGVHVCSLGEPDKARTLQTQQPTLNVPGSYWLSHKQNIYKFTFKYNEPTRDTKEFLYEDELMKVIKRIIKSQPSQGQLSTVHLSITYKHTFWTRQDKMFAMLKFRNRQGATVYPQAFILTISVIDNPGSQINGLLIKGDPNLNCDGRSSEKLLPNSRNPVDTDALNERAPAQTEDSLKFTKIFQQFDSPHNLTSLTTTATNTTVCQKSFTITDSDTFSNDSKSLEDMTSRWTRFSGRRSQKDTCTNSIDVSAMERHNDILNQGDTLAMVDDDQKARLQDFSTAVADKDEQGGGIGERGTNPEPITPRSSNITDQVMEGLMFTIKQVEDNVKVVEQRTKMELDEVLENSEKVETKEGQRCLVNSSLLRLENLVTKIETLDKRFKDSEITDTAPVIDGLASQFSEDSVLDRNGFSSTGCLVAQPDVEKQAGIFASRTNRSPLTSSSESNSYNRIKTDEVLNQLFPSFDRLIPIELRDVRLADESEIIKEEFHHNLIGQKKRKFDSNEIKAREFREPTAIANRNAEKHISGRGSGSAADDEDDDDDNNNNNNNNNNKEKKEMNKNNVSNGEVQIDMWKLLQDITRGAKVVVERISDIDIRNATRSSMISVSAARGTGRRILTRRKK